MFHKIRFGWLENKIQAAEQSKQEDLDNYGLEKDELIWIDFPTSSFGRSWSWGDSIALVVATFVYIIPGVIFLIWKLIAMGSYKEEMKEADKAQNLALKVTGNYSMLSMIHLGGHPNLPLKKRIVIGLDENNINFYDYDLNILTSLSVMEVVVSTDIRNIHSTSYGSTYVPKDSNFGSTVISNSVTLQPDTLKMGIVIQGQPMLVEFDSDPYDPLETITIINQMKTKNGYDTKLVENKNSNSPQQQLENIENQKTLQQNSITYQLEKLAELNGSGALTDEEFRRAKERILS